MERTPWFKYLKHISRREKTHDGREDEKMRRQDIQREKKERKKRYAMQVPHWWSRDRSSCRHLWYPITGLQRNTPRIVHLPASVLENGASRPWHALACARFREDSRFSGVLKVAVNTGFDDLQWRFALIRGVTRDRSQRRPVARHRRLISFTSRRMRSGRGTVVSSAVSLNSVHRESLYRSIYRSIDTDHSPKSAPGHQTHA